MLFLPLELRSEMSQDNISIDQLMLIDENLWTNLILEVAPTIDITTSELNQLSTIIKKCWRVVFKKNKNSTGWLKNNQSELQHLFIIKSGDILEISNVARVLSYTEQKIKRFFKDVEEIKPDIKVRNKGRPPLTFLC